MADVQITDLISEGVFASRPAAADAVEYYATDTKVRYYSDGASWTAQPPTVETHVHSGADITSGTVVDARLDAALARDSEVTSAISTHAGLSDPHPGYTTAAELAAAKLDDFATPDDNTDLDATTGHHGLLPKLGGGSTNYLRADGTWDAPGGTGAVATDSIWDAAGDLAQGTGANTATKLSAGTAGYVLTSAGAAAAVAWAAPATPARTEATLGADVTMTTANTEYDGPTLTPAAGVYDVLAYDMVKSGVTNVITAFVGRLKYGSTVVDERQVVGYVGNDFGYPVVIPLSARITADGSTAIKISSTCDKNSAVMCRDPFNNSSGVHRGCLLVLTKVG